MSKIRTTILTAAITGGSIIGLAGMTGIADAADDDGIVVVPLEVGDESGVRPGEAPTDVEHAERRAERVERRAERGADRQAMADLLGLELDDLAEQLRAGATLADVAEAQGVATSDVVDLIVQQLTERIDRAVENGRITAEQAAEKIAELEERAQTRVEEGRPERGGEGPRGRGGPRCDPAGHAADHAVDEATDDASDDAEATTTDPEG